MVAREIARREKNRNARRVFIGRQQTGLRDGELRERGRLALTGVAGQNYSPVACEGRFKPAYRNELPAEVNPRAAGPRNHLKTIQNMLGVLALEPPKGIKQLIEKTHPLDSARDCITSQSTLRPHYSRLALNLQALRFSAL